MSNCALIRDTALLPVKSTCPVCLLALYLSCPPSTAPLVCPRPFQELPHQLHFPEDAGSCGDCGRAALAEGSRSGTGGSPSGEAGTSNRVQTTTGLLLSKATRTIVNSMKNTPTISAPVHFQALLDTKSPFPYSPAGLKPLCHRCSAAAAVTVLHSISIRMTWISCRVEIGWQTPI